ncbi:MAG: transcriptional repressor [Bacteroidota bacterium]
MGIIRKTKTVTALLQIFEERSSAISVVDLVAQFNGKANKTTIYRILDRLQSDGLIHSFRGQDGLTWYAKCISGCSTDHHSDIHPHFQCQECGKVECLPISIDLPKVDTHDIQSAEVLLVGQCSDCRK